MNTIDPAAAVVKILFGMAKGHTYFWRRPGRRDEERKQFSALMKKVEAVRLRYGLTKTELAAKLGENVDGVRAWMSGRTVGRKTAVARLEEFIRHHSVSSQPQQQRPRDR